MAPIRSRGSRKKAPPAGYSDIEDTLLSYDNQMRDAINSSTDGKKKHEAQWPIFQVTHRKARYIWDMFYEREAISRELYDWLLKNDSSKSIAQLHAKWKKVGYEQLCCLRCVQTKETNFGGSCICRVPKASLRRSDDAATTGDDGDTAAATGKHSGGGSGPCISCGCRGCASGD